MKKGLKSATGLADRCRRGTRGVRGVEGLERRKERGGQPDKQNPCCFISARLARHRPFLRACFRPTLAATPARWTRATSLVDVPRRTGLSVQYFSSSLINGTAESKDASCRNGIDSLRHESIVLRWRNEYYELARMACTRCERR